MGINKVQYGNTTLIDLTFDTVTADKLMQGYTAHDRTGALITGTATGGTAAISVVDTTDSAGGTIRTITALDISDTTAVASDVAQGKYFYTAAGAKTAGTGGGGGGATQHTIHLEFTDSTDTDIDVYYDDSLISTMITAYEPITYGQKTVDVAELDGVAWYTRPSGTWETVLNGNLHVNTGNPYGGVWVSDLGSVSIALGSVWRVTIDNGTPYTVTATANGVYGSPNQNIIGNPLFMGGTDDGSDVPFAFEQNPWGAWTGGTDTSITQDVDHIFKIERQVSA